MATYGVSITKKVTFRGVDQEFSNVYHYSGPTLSVADATTLASNIKAEEVSLHSTDVTFLRYKVWSAGAGQATNQMIAQGNLSGTGNQVTNSTMDRERAVLIRWAAGFDSRGHAVYLRKWFHSCGACSGVSFGSTVQQNTAQIASADRTTIANDANALKTIVVSANNYNLIAESGRAALGNAECHQYLEHHQLGDMWR